MNIVKPQSLGIMFRTMEYRKRFGLCVSGYLHVPFVQGDRPQVWGEQSMWDFVLNDMQPALIDEGISKLTSEFLVNGYAYSTAQRRNAVAVRARLGATEKTVLVFGDRYWDGNAPSEPAPFERMPLTWSNSYGGPDFPANVAGKGRQAQDGVRWLPNLELPGARIRSPDQAVVPAGFGAIDVMHPQRAALRGTHDQAWLEEHSMGFAPDLNWKFFNMAMADQWIESPLRGDETFSLENLHPTQPLIEGRLPGLKVRTFARYAFGEGENRRTKMREISMRLSTVWFFPHAERMVLVFHGLAESTQDDASDIDALVGAIETLSEESRRSDAHYLSVLEKRAAPGPAAALQALNDSDLVSPQIDFDDPDTAARQAALKPEGLATDALHARAVADVAIARAEARARGKDPDELGLIPPKLEPAPTPREMPAYIEKLAKQIEDERWAMLDEGLKPLETVLDLIQQKRIDPKQLVRRGPPPLQTPLQLEQLDREMNRVGKKYDRNAMAARLVQADLMAQRNYRESAHMQAPALALQGDAAAAARAEVEWLLGRGIRTLVGIDLTGADLSDMDLRRVDFSGAYLESANLSGSNLSYSKFHDSVLAHARLHRTVAIRSDFLGANLGGADFHQSVFDQSNLTKATLMRARFRNADFRGASLLHANLLETQWDGVDLTDAQLPELVFLNLLLKNVAFTGANLQSTQFIECELDRPDFTSAQLHSTGFVDSRAEGARFASARMEGTVFAGKSVFMRSDFTDAMMKGANLGSGRFDGSRFVRAVLDNANLLKAALPAADLRLASAKNAMFRKADLAGARLERSNLKDALLYGADLRGADLRQAQLFGTDLTRVHLDGTSRIDGAVLERARVYPRHRPVADGGEN